MHPICQHLAMLLLVSAGTVAIAADAATSRIYRTTDEHGNVVLTDIPPRDGESAEQVVLAAPNTFTAEEALPDAQTWIVEEDGDVVEASFSYRTLSIASPQDDQAVRENAGNLTVVANISPVLQPGHIMRLLMDGSVVQEGPQSSFELANVDRGTHTIALEVVDQEGIVLKRSDSITFHMLRVSILTVPRG